MSNSIVNRNVFYWLSLASILLISLLMSVSTAYANTEVEDIDKDYEEGDIKQHDMFEFEAFVKHGDVSFGTAPFDANDEPGNDSSDDNGIVRTWDTVTYPLKITVNPKKADSLKNIKLKISGTLENGITDGDRVNAKYAVGGKEDIAKEEVSFVQEYTIERTGNSIMIPVTVEVQGAKHGVQLRPDFKVEVISIDGEKINGVVTHFDELPSATVSSKVNIKAYVTDDFGSYGIPYYPYQGISGNDDDRENIHQFSVVFGIERLAGKSDIRGATFPDSNGKIKYRVDLSGNVSWDDAGRGKTGRDSFNFEGRDSQFLLFDHNDVNATRNKIGSPNTMMEGRSYSYPYAAGHRAPYSKMTNFNESTIKSQQDRYIWDSGKWFVDKPEQKRNTITYKGYNTDYVIGSTFPTYRGRGGPTPTFGAQDRIFSAQGFIVFMPNEYRIGGPNNKDEYRNTVTYRADVTLESYEDEEGNEITFNKRGSATFTERNLRFGTYSVSNTFRSYPGGAQLGTPSKSYVPQVKGDASTLIGEDVQFHSAFQQNIVSYGGYRRVYRWNTDSFELTKRYATLAENSIRSTGYHNPALNVVKNNYQTQHVYYGVAKFSDNSYSNFTSKGIDDYDWYDSYDEAVTHGPIGAMQDNVTAPTGATKLPRPNLPLRVKHENIGIGAESKQGTASIAMTQVYVYSDEERKHMREVTANYIHKNPAIWDDSGNMLKIQDPRGSSYNLETLAVVPAETSTVVESNKSTYYNSESIKWTTKNSIILPRSGVPDNLDTGVRITHTLPAGLDYSVGTGRIGNTAYEPEIVVNDNGTKTLTWNLLVSNSTHKIDTVTFETTINPFALSSGVQSSVEVKSVIESELDQRPINLRTASHSATILKVGMVGIHGTIDKLFGPRNSDFTVTLNPYTTIEDERDVAGLTHIPKNNDGIGSKLTGKVFLKDISLEVDRENNGTVDIYLNDKYIETDKPNNIDVSKDGWYKYDRDKTPLDKAQSIYFIVDGLMTNRDDIRISLTMQTQNNSFGDTYMNETNINSAVDYKLSPISNRVRYTIRPDWELSMERIQIFTDKYDNGLPVRVRIGEQQPYGKDADISDLSFDLVLYDKESGEKVASQKVKQPDFKNEITMKIPKEKLKKKGDKRRYEARIEGYDVNRVWAKEPKIDTDGYTASEKVISVSDIEDGQAIQAGVAVTERVLGQSITEYKDEITLNDVDIYSDPFVTKSGYSYQFAGELQYTNEMLETVKNVVGINTSTDVEYLVDKALVDQNLIDGDYADSDAFKVVGDKISIKPSAIEDGTVNKSNTTYSLEDILIERGTGKLFTRSQVEKIKNDNKESNYQPFIDTTLIVDEKYQDDNILYVPIWIDELGEYGINLTSNIPIGSNYVTFDLDGTVKVEAYMFNHIDSDTTKKDEILINQFKNE